MQLDTSKLGEPILQSSAVPEFLGRNFAENRLQTGINSPKVQSVAATILASEQHPAELVPIEAPLQRANTAKRGVHQVGPIWRPIFWAQLSSILAARHPREWGWSVKLGTKTNCSPPGHLLSI